MARIFKSFAELAAALAADEDDRGSHTPEAEPDPPDLDALLRAIDEAEATLAAAARADQEASERARQLLESYDALRARHAAATAAAARATALRERAEDLRERTVDDTARDAATRALSAAASASAAATLAAERLRAEVERASHRPDVRRALELRSQLETRCAADTARLQRQARVDELIAAVRSAVARGDATAAKCQLHEVVGLLSGAEGDAPEVGYDEQVRELRIGVAVLALHQARRLIRRDPAGAATAIDRADLAALPDDLRRHLVGVWIGACAGTCALQGLADARLVRLPEPGYGAVIARRDGAAPYAVVGVLGADGPFTSGMTVPDSVARGACPLRAAKALGARVGNTTSEECHAH